MNLINKAKCFFCSLLILHLIVIFTQFDIMAATCGYGLGAWLTILDPVRAGCDLRMMDLPRMQMNFTSNE